MSHPFDLACKNHPDRLIADEFRPDRLCRECGLQAWNAGARQADAAWHNAPAPRYQDERAPDGRSIHSEMRGDLKRPESERKA